MMTDLSTGKPKLARPDAGAPRRRGGPQVVFDVVSTERISSHLVRVHLGGPAFEQFIATADPAKLATTDKYVKLLFAKPSLGLTPPFDLDALRETLAPEDMPVRRTYTVRSVDFGTRQIAIDFVVHGDEGVAGPWAAAAKPGDRLALSGPGGQYSPADGDVEHFYFGDDSAIPAIAAALESLPFDARGLALIEVAGAAGELPLTHPTGVEIRWVHRVNGDERASAGRALATAVAALERPAGAVDVFAHGERETMKELRSILSGQWGVERRAMSLSAYWAQGRNEDAFQAEKRQPIGQIFPD